MKSLKKNFGKGIIIGIIASSLGMATPSTQIWNPSTDIQPTGVWHLGIDNYFTQEGPADGGYALPSDVGMTYGINSNIEVGVDVFEPQSSPVVFNFKYKLLDEASAPLAVAVGGFGFGTKKDETNQNVGYGVIAKTFEIGRFSIGYYNGNDQLLINPTTGDTDHSGGIFSWDKQLNDKLWVCIDHAGSKSFLGATFYGLSWVFAPNTSIIFGYGTYNNGDIKPTFTTQLDINI